MTLLSRLFNRTLVGRKRRLTVALVGYYGWGNYGDEFFKLVLQVALPSVRFLHLHTMIQAPYFPPDFRERLADVDAVLIGGGDLLIPWAVSPLYWEPAFLNKPVFIYGVGVPTRGGVQEQCVTHYRKFLSHPSVQTIVARDPESMNWIGEHLMPDSSKLSWAPDIVCAADFDQFPTHRDGAIFGLITRAHQPKLHDNLIAACALAVSKQYKIHHVVLGTGATREDDLAEARGFPFAERTLIVRDDIDSLTQEIAHCSVIASWKFHGCVASAMLGIPAVTLSRSDKFRAFYRLLGQPHFLSEPQDAELPEKLGRAMDSIVPEHTTASLRQQARAGLKDLEMALWQSKRR